MALSFHGWLSVMFRVQNWNVVQYKGYVLGLETSCLCVRPEGEGLAKAYGTEGGDRAKSYVHMGECMVWRVLNNENVDN